MRTLMAIRSSRASALVVLLAAAAAVRVDPPTLPRSAASSGARNFAPQSESPQARWFQIERGWSAGFHLLAE